MAQQTQDKKISQLTAKGSVDGTERIPVAHGGQNYTLTTGQLKQYIGSAVDITGMLSGDTISDENLELLEQYTNEKRVLIYDDCIASYENPQYGNFIAICIQRNMLDDTYGSNTVYIEAIVIEINKDTKAIQKEQGVLADTVFMQMYISQLILQLYERVDHGTDDTGTDSAPYQLRAQVFHLYGTVDKLNFRFAKTSDLVVPEYKFQFTSGATPTVLTLPSDVRWAGSSEIEANHTYQVSIVNNIAVMIGVPNE